MSGDMGEENSIEQEPKQSKGSAEESSAEASKDTASQPPLAPVERHAQSEESQWSGATAKAPGVEESTQQEIAKPAKKKAVSKKKAEISRHAVLDRPEPAREEKFGGSDAKAWYVVHTLSGQENKVKENLESRLPSEEMTEFVSQVLIPTENVSEVKSGKKTVTTRKFFPGYVLVNMVLNEKSWYFIRNTSGVIGFVGTGKPVPLQDHEVGEVLSQIEEKKEKVKPKVMFDVGENIKVNDGPFVNFTGTVEEVNPDRGKLKVMVSIFGRATPIELEYWQVERS